MASLANEDENHTYYPHIERMIRELLSELGKGKFGNGNSTEMKRKITTTNVFLSILN